jgi:sugar lactone lactonase YvrE
MMKSRRIIATVLTLLTIPAVAVHADLVITEIMSRSGHSAPTDCDWWELTNTGPASFSLLGYSWDDDHQRVGMNAFPDITIDAGESIIIREVVTSPDDLWRQEWGLGPETGIYAPSTFSRLGGDDGIFLYDENGGLITSASYGNSVVGLSNAWDTSGTSLGSSVDGEYGAWRSANLVPDTASPGYAYVAPDAAPQQSTLLYWTDKDTARIQRINMETGLVETVLAAADGLREPRGLGLDPVGEKMIWTDGIAGTIHQTNLDGTDDQILIRGQVAPTDLALDLAHAKMYWSETGTSRIHRANIDGSSIETIISGLGQCYYLELDLVNRKIYWSQLGPQISGTLIFRANLDGSEVEHLITGTGHTRDIVLDLAAGKMYWGDRSAANPGIFRADLDGTNIEQLYSNAQGLIRPHGLLLDIPSGLIYWSDTRTYAIQRAPMDGPGLIEDVVTGLDAPWRLAFLEITTDIDQDGRVDFIDFAHLASSWRDSPCDWDNLWCHRTDLTGDGIVNLNDLLRICDRWLVNSD